MCRVRKALINAKAAGGYGLALLMVFIASTVLVGVSFQMVSTPASIAFLGSASQDYLAAKELAMVGLDETEADIRTKLQAGTSITTAYRYPASGSNSVNIPSDPTNLASSGVQVGSYYATIPQARGTSYLIKVTATVGGSTVEYNRLILANKVTASTPTPSYDCSVVESQVLAGNIASVSDANLIAWAQNDCMVKTASVTMQTPTAGSGTSNTCSATATTGGTISYASLSSSTCSPYLVTGTYTGIQLNSTSSALNFGTLLSYPNAGVASRAIHVPGDISNQTAFRAQNGSGTLSTIPHNFYFNNTNPASAPVISGGNGDDKFYLNGASTVDLYTYDGFNEVFINGTWGSSDNGDYMELGATGNTGANNVYINTLTNYPGNGATISTNSTGVTKLYFNNIAGDNVYVSGGNGSDIFGCGVSFTGGTGTCGTFGNYASANVGINGGAGNDIISINAKVENDYTIQGGTGNNIVYVKGCGGSATATTSIQGGSSTSLTVIGGNRNADCWANGSGGSAVILKKSGITEGNSTSGYARTLTY